MAVRSIALWVGKPYDNDELFNAESPVDPDKRWAPVQLLKRTLEGHGIRCHTQDIFQREGTVPDVVYFQELPRRPVAELLGSWAGKVDCWAIIPWNWDMRLHDQFSAIFTWSDRLIDGKKYFKANFANIFPDEINSDTDHRPGFCTMISANKVNPHPLDLYSERVKTARWFEDNHPEEFDLYGVGWDSYVFRGSRFARALNRIKPLTRLLAPRFPSYRGTIDKKLPVLSRYKYSICYENARDIPGYITEKIFDCLFAGCIPVYWGAPDIARHVAPRCFIDRRDFRTHEELYRYMRSMTASEYGDRLDAIGQYVRAAHNGPFSAQAYADTVLGRACAK